MLIGKFLDFVREKLLQPSGNTDQVESSTTHYQFAILPFTGNLKGLDVFVKYFYVRLLAICQGSAA